MADISKIDIGKEVFADLQRSFVDGSPENTLDLEEWQTIFWSLIEGSQFKEGGAEALNLFLDHLSSHQMSFVVYGKTTPVNLTPEVFEKLSLPGMAHLLGRTVEDHVVRLNLLQATQEDPTFKSETIEKYLGPLCGKEGYEEAIARGVKGLKEKLAPLADSLSLDSTFYQYFRDPEGTFYILSGAKEKPALPEILTNADTPKLFRDIVLVGQVHPQVAPKVKAWVEEVWDSKHRWGKLDLIRLPQNYFIPAFNNAPGEAHSWYDKIDQAIRFKEMLIMAKFRLGKILELKETGVDPQDLKPFEKWRLEVEKWIEGFDKRIIAIINDVDFHHERVRRAKLRFLGQEELVGSDTRTMSVRYLTTRREVKGAEFLGTRADSQIDYLFSQVTGTNLPQEASPSNGNKLERGFRFEKVDAPPGDLPTDKVLARLGPYKAGCYVDDKSVDFDGDKKPDLLEICADLRPAGRPSAYLMEVAVMNGRHEGRNREVIHQVETGDPQCIEGCYLVVADATSNKIPLDGIPDMVLARKIPQTGEIKPSLWWRGVGERWFSRPVFEIGGSFNFQNSEPRSLSTIINSPPLELEIGAIPTSREELLDRLLNDIDPKDLNSAESFEKGIGKPFNNLLVDGGIPVSPLGAGQSLTLRLENFPEFQLTEWARFDLGAQIAFNYETVRADFSPNKPIVYVDETVGPPQKVVDDGEEKDRETRRAIVLLSPSNTMPFVDFNFGLEQIFRLRPVPWIALRLQEGLSYQPLSFITTEVQVFVDRKEGRVVDVDIAVSNPEINGFFRASLGADLFLDIPLSWFDAGHSRFVIRLAAGAHWMSPTFGGKHVNMGPHWIFPIQIGFGTDLGK